MSKPTKRDLQQADQMLSREARLEDVTVVAQLLADLRAARVLAPSPSPLPTTQDDL